MKVAFYASSILSSYWNGAATYYRGLIRALAGRGYRVTFFEPSAFGRHDKCDIEPPPWCEVVVFPPTIDAAKAAAARAGEADVVVKASGVGVLDDELLTWTMAAARRDALKVWWDVDAPATLAFLAEAPVAPLRRQLPELDAVIVYGGGASVVNAYRSLGARLCEPVYNALDPETHHPVPPDPRFGADLGFLGNRMPDREARVGEFFLEPARRMPDAALLLGGAGWNQAELPGNVKALGHVPTGDHNAFNVTPRAILNINRQSMAVEGFSPPTRIFEACGAGACVLTDEWPGIEQFLAPGNEILVVRDAGDVVDCMSALTEERAREIGARARARLLGEHTYEKRAKQADALFRRLLQKKRIGAAA